MTKSELRMAKSLQDACKTLCIVADEVDPKRERRGLAAKVDKIVIDMATTFHELTGHNIYNTPSTDLDPESPARWAQRSPGWQNRNTSRQQ
jgi:hypothetical protein